MERQELQPGLYVVQVAGSGHWSKCRQVVMVEECGGAYLWGRDVFGEAKLRRDGWLWDSIESITPVATSQAEFLATLASAKYMALMPEWDLTVHYPLVPGRPNEADEDRLTNELDVLGWDLHGEHERQVRRFCEDLNRLLERAEQRGQRMISCAEGAIPLDEFIAARPERAKALRERLAYPDLKDRKDPVWFVADFEHNAGATCGYMLLIDRRPYEAHYHVIKREEP